MYDAYVFPLKEFKEINLDSYSDFENWDVTSSYVCGLKHFWIMDQPWEFYESVGLHSQKNVWRDIIIAYN